jgi:hypothetical protein
LYRLYDSSHQHSGQVKKKRKVANPNTPVFGNDGKQNVKGREKPAFYEAIA